VRKYIVVRSVTVTVFPTPTSATVNVLSILRAPPADINNQKRNRKSDRPTDSVAFFDFTSQAITEEPFTAVANNFTRLYNNLNLMWLTSIFFNQKKNMERLFEAISNSIADRVSNTLKIPELFK